MNNFKIGELVYHRTLGVFGTFTGIDDIDKDSCGFEFKDEYNFDDYKRVSLDKLEKSKYNIDDKVVCIKTVRESCILKMKVGQTGVVENISYKYLYVKLTNDEVVKCTIDKIDLYKKENKFSIKNCTSEELIDRFETLIQNECCSKTTKTKSYNKLLNDIENYREEILNRMNNL